MLTVNGIKHGILLFPTLTALCLGGLACAIQSPAIKPIDMQKPPAVVQSPVKAHLLDGSTVVYPNGVTLHNFFLSGAGLRYPVGPGGAVQAGSIPIDSVVGMEAYDRKVNVPASVVATAGAAALGAVVTAVALVAIFGSCPTFYSDSAGVELLQGEGFSYSIAPLLEQRDVDRLRLTPGPDGRLVLRVRNEALETHYINHVEIIEAVHDKGESIFPDQDGRPVAVSNVAAPTSVTDRSGRDISRAIGAADDILFSTNAATLDNATATDLDDWIELVIPAASGGADSVAVVMDMRNSLLNTVLLYDHILAAPGLASLDFLGKNLENISGAVEMAKWYTSHMGMRISVRDGNSWRQVARIGDSGPIAFHQLAVMVPAITNGGNSVRVRLAFVVDDWRIDAIRASTSWRRPATRVIPAARVAMLDSSQNRAALASILDPDEGYLITSPGQSFRVEFEAGEQISASRTFMLASQGYYTEWVRGSWIKGASGKRFEPTNATLLEAIHDWRAKQGDMERRFYSSRIATR